MGSSASVGYTPCKETNLFNNERVERVCIKCFENRRARRALAKHIKDGSWMDRLGLRIPRNYLDEDNAYIVPSTIDKKGVYKPALFPNNDKIGLDELLLFFLIAVSEDFALYPEPSTRVAATSDCFDMKKNASFFIEEGDLLRNEVMKAEELFFHVATYYDEEDFINILSREQWSHGLSELIDNLQVPVSIIETNFKQNKKTESYTSSSIVYANKNWENMTKRNVEEYVGKSFEETLFGPETEQKQIKIINEAIESDRTIKLGLTCNRKNGETFLNLMGVVPIVSNNTGNFRYVAVVHCDTSNIKNLNKRLSDIDKVMTLLPLVVKNPDDDVLFSTDTDTDESVK